MNKEVSLPEIESYLGKNSDFSFEMKILKLLSQFGDSAHYSGSYVDPVTDKQRQYDFQLRLELGEFVLIACIEAKNIKVDKPIIVHRTPRKEQEAFYEVIACQGGSRGTSYHGPTVKRAMGCTNLVQRGDFVGRSFDQYNGQTKDDQLFDKFSQPTNCAGSILRHDRPLFKQRQKIIGFLPVLVVPDGSLWVVDYSDQGEVIHQPEKAAITSYFLGAKWDFFESLKFVLSHLFILTESNLIGFLSAASKTHPEGMAFPYLEGVTLPNNNNYV